MSATFSSAKRELGLSYAGMRKCRKGNSDGGERDRLRLEKLAPVPRTVYRATPIGV